MSTEVWDEEEQRRQIEMLERVASFGAEPEDVEGLPHPNGNGAAALPEADASLFSAADLDLFAFPAERFKMPNGKWVWVHALSPAQVMYLSRQVAREIRNLGLQSNEERQAEALLRGQVWQAVLACRQGPSPSDPPVFTAKDAEKLRKRQGWFESCQRISALSDRMGAGEEEERQALISFFGHAERFSQTWCTRLTADSWEACRQDLARFATCVSLVKSRGSLAASDVGLMRELAEG